MRLGAECRKRRVSLRKRKDDFMGSSFNIRESCVLERFMTEFYCLSSTCILYTDFWCRYLSMLISKNFP